MQETVTDEDILRLVRASTRNRAYLLDEEDAAGVVLSKLYGEAVNKNSSVPKVDQIKAKKLNYASTSVRNLASTEVKSLGVV